MENTPETPSETIDAAAETDPAAHDKTPHAKKEKFQLTPEMKADPVSRKLMMLSAVFASLALLCIGFLTYIHHQKKQSLKVAEPETTTHQPTVMITHTLQEIHVVLKNEQDLRVEIVVECSQRETCDHIKKHIPEVQDLLIPILSSIDPNEFSNIENKITIRKKLTDRLNTLEMTGKVIQVHFNNLSIEGSPK